MHPDMNQPRDTKSRLRSQPLVSIRPIPRPPASGFQSGAKRRMGPAALLTSFFKTTVNALAVPIYSIALKMDPLLLAIALAVPKIVGAILDPIVGAVSDNARTRWGRRRPFIMGGAVIGAMLLPLIWMPPTATQIGRFVYLVVDAFDFRSGLFNLFHSIRSARHPTHH